jgi:beta-glucosidase
MNDAPDLASLVGQLTVEEKASQCLGSDFWHTAPVPRLGVPAIMVSDGPHGLRRQPKEGDHVGIGGSVPATCFPTAAALGSSWDLELVRRVGEALGLECREQGVSVLLGPGINIKRSRCAVVTSSTSRRIRSSLGFWARRWSRVCRARESAPA